MSIFAHSLPEDDETRWEPLRDHLRDVGELTAQFARHFGAGETGRAIGLLHDIGKRSSAYQRYIRTPGANRGPDHSTAGARALLNAYDKRGQLAAFAIAGHHAGLADGVG